MSLCVKSIKWLKRDRRRKGRRNLCEKGKWGKWADLGEATKDSSNLYLVKRPFIEKHWMFSKMMWYFFTPSLWAPTVAVIPCHRPWQWFREATILTSPPRLDGSRDCAGSRCRSPRVWGPHAPALAQLMQDSLLTETCGLSLPSQGGHLGKAREGIPTSAIHSEPSSVHLPPKYPGSSPRLYHLRGQSQTQRVSEQDSTSQWYLDSMGFLHYNRFKTEVATGSETTQHDKCLYRWQRRPARWARPFSCWGWITRKEKR